MNRAFISLYVIVVLAIVLLGLVLNKFWDAVDPAAELDPAIEDLLQIAEATLASSSIEHADRQQKIVTLSNQLHYQIQLINLEDFSQTSILNDIKNGKTVNASNENDIRYYKRIGDSNDVIALVYKADNTKAKPIYIAFVLLFYSAVALIIFLWVWPLSRDLARLADHTQEIGKDGVPQNIRISSRSMLFPFAKSFNAMAKRLNELIKSQKEMTYAVSHELRTPLARMKFALAMVEEDAQSKILQKQLMNVQQDISDMESLINSLLVYAAFDQQSQSLNQRSGHIRDLLDAIIARLTLHKHGDIDIYIDDQTESEAFVCEWALMQTALQNLLDNALGFALKKIVITLKTTAESYFIDIDDDGPGVPIDQRGRVFESFVRLYVEGSRRSGFGLGLAIVQRVLSWHLGTVECADSSLGGACFKLAWPKPVSESLSVTATGDA